ncbi:hypothetical protein D2Q93_04295 [Alicyclobacillaceae bacterium I2511]|nr:hypothetical protein D2Q93_04295 [Alicyclobacillaceae bacterium I2511]
MRLSLAEMLGEAQGGPISFGAKSVHMSYTFNVNPGQEFEIEFLRYKNSHPPYRQGIEISVDRRQGYLALDDHDNETKYTRPIFFTDTAPNKIRFRCFPKGDSGIMRIWNVWIYSKEVNRVDAWIGNAGLYVEQLNDALYEFHCSHGPGEVDFEDLVFRVQLDGAPTEKVHLSKNKAHYCTQSEHDTRPVDSATILARLKFENPYRYFRHPYQFSTYTDNLSTCELCGQYRTGYMGEFYGLEEMEFVCEECLINGKLGENGFTTNEGDKGSLVRQLQGFGVLSNEEIEMLAQKCTVDLEQRTPFIPTYQHLFVPAHCGDYCCYLKQAGQSDFNELSPDGEGKRFLSSMIDDHIDVGYLWSSMRSDSPQNAELTTPIGVYLFQCIHCGRYKVAWDHDDD